MHERAILCLEHAAKLDVRVIPDAAENRRDAEILCEIRRLNDDGVFVEGPFTYPLDEAAESRTRSENRPDAPGHAVGDGEEIGIAAKDAADRAGELDLLAQFTAGDRIDVADHVVGPSPWLSAELQGNARREAHRVATRLGDDAPLRAGRERTAQRLRPAATQVREALVDAAKSRIRRNEHGAAHPAPKTDDFPGAEKLNAFTDAKRRRDTQVADICQALPLIEVRAEHADRRPVRRKGVRRGNEPETRVAEEGRQRGSGLCADVLGITGGLIRGRLRRGGGHSYRGEQQAATQNAHVHTSNRTSRVESSRARQSLIRAAGLRAGSRSPTETAIHISCRGRHETSATPATDLATLAARVAGFVGCPLVRGALFVSGAPALAGDLALLFRGHRSKSAAFFAHSVHSIPPRYSTNQPVPRRCDSHPAGREGYKSDASPAETHERLSGWIRAIYRSGQIQSIPSADVDPYS